MIYLNIVYKLIPAASHTNTIFHFLCFILNKYVYLSPGFYSRFSRECKIDRILHLQY